MKRSSRRPAVLATAAAALILGCGALQLQSASAAPVSPAAAAVTAVGAAAGGPGAASYFDLARKDCLGTAENTTSKVWYTVADGVLSDVYEPTVDNTNVETLQYVVTDGSTFTDLQTRDMTYTVQADPTGMACTITSTDAKHGFELVTTYVTDPQRDTVLMNTRIEPTKGSRTNVGALQIYARLDAHVNGDGGGGTRERRRQHRRRRRAHRRPGRLQHEHDHRGGQPHLRGADLHGADRHLRGPGLGRLRGHRQRRADPARRRAHADADHLGRRRAHRGHRERDPAARARTARSPSPSASAARSSRPSTPPTASLRSPSRCTAQAYATPGHAYDATLNRRPRSVPGSPSRRSQDLLPRRERAEGQRGQDVPGRGRRLARVALGPGGQRGRRRRTASRSTSAPTARSSPATLTRPSPASWPTATWPPPARQVEFLLDQQQLPTGAMPRNSLLNGKAAPDTGGDQLDETAVPDPDGLPVRARRRRRAVDGAHQAGRRLPGRARPLRTAWSAGRSSPGYSPSTIAAEIAGLTAAAAIAAEHHDTGRRGGLPGHRRRLPAQHAELDGHHHRPRQLLALLHPAVQDRRPERRDHLQPRQRRPDRGPAHA